MRPPDIAAQGYERFRDGRAARGAAPVEGDDLVRLLVALMRDSDGAYRAPEGQQLAGVRVVYRDRRELTVAASEGEIDGYDRTTLAQMVEEITRWFLFHSGHDDPPPTAEQLVWNIGRGWSQAGAFSCELRPVFEPAPTTPPRRGKNRRRFRHPDGRIWAVDPDGSELRLTMLFPDDPEVVERSKSFAGNEECRAAAEALIAEQLADGFDEDWVIAAAGASRMGEARSRNEDRFHVDVDRGLFVVADAGKDPLAAELVVEHVRRAVEAPTADPSTALLQGIEAADWELCARIEAEPALVGTFATVVALLIRGSTAHAAQVGFSHAYALSSGAVELLTPNAWSEAPGEWDPVSDLDFEKALERRREQARVVGSGEVLVKQNRVEVKEGDAWILCSDGVHLPTEERMGEVALHGSGAGFDPDDASLGRMAARLLTLDGADDNRTAVCVAVKAFSATRDFPARLLREVKWTFPVPQGEKPAKRAGARELRKLPANVVLVAPEVNVLFDLWDPKAEDRVTVKLTLKAPNGESFTTRELLAALSEGVARAQRDGRTLGDHQFFEGLELTKADGDVPTYFIGLGS